MSTQVPPILARLVDDAAVFPPGSASLGDALAAHRRHRASWYAHLVGPLLVPASALPELTRLVDEEPTPADRLEIGVIGDVPLSRLAQVCADVDPRLRIRQVEAVAAPRGADPLPGIAELSQLARAGVATGPPDDGHVYAELPIDRALPTALDRLAAQRAGGTRIAAKFRTGGLPAEHLPTPVALAGVIAACRDREVPFKLTAGLHHATRSPDEVTGLSRHGFLNVLAAVLAAADGAGVEELADLLLAPEPRPLLRRISPQRARPLWVGFGSCSIREPLTDLIRLGLMDGGCEQ